MLNLPSHIPIDAAWLPPDMRDAAVGRRYRVRFSTAERRSMVKKKYVRPSEWCERHIHLPPDAPIPGPWRNINMPHVPGILDASFYPSVREIMCCWAPQSAKTAMALCAIGYSEDRIPGNFLCIYPDIKTSKETITDRLVPMFKESPRLRTYLTGYDDDVSAARIKLTHRKIYVGWASSIASMAAKSLPYAILDEECKYEWSNKETTPPNLVRKRLRRFLHMSKLWRMSSPAEETDLFWTDFRDECDAIFDYCVCCPVCGAYQVMEFGDKKSVHGIKWAGGKQADPKVIEKQHHLTWYVCAKCHERWDDGMRDRAARAGQWRERESGMAIEAYLKHHNPRVIGSHMPAWSVVGVPMAQAAAQFIRGQKDLEALKDFQNGFSALPWKTPQRERKVTEILSLRDERPEGKVPGGGRVAALTFGVDTQGDDASGDLWFTIRAWGYGLDPDNWEVRSGKVTSLTALFTVLWQSEYRDASGNVYPVRFGLQDAMGHRADEVYNFSVANRGFVLPSQGKDELAQLYTMSNLEFFPGSKKPIPGGLQLVRINTTYFKNRLARKLGVKPGDPGAMYFHADYPEAYAAHLTVEEVDDKGHWQNPKKRENHLWDCEVLAAVAYEILGVKYWPVPDAQAVNEEPQQIIAAQSSYLTGGRR